MDSRDTREEVKGMIVPGNITQDIFKRQERLMFSYKEIEKWGVDWPLDMNAKSSQLLIKDMIARVVEELAESYETFLVQDWDNTWEELSDALHFMVETFILSGYSYRFFMINSNHCAIKGIYHRAQRGDARIIYTYPDKAFCKPDWENWFWQITYYLNLARNALRNKKWKQTEVFYNEPEYESCLTLALTAFIEGFSSMGKDPEFIWREYVAKNMVNEFRIKSKY
jgi:hypothetical protein